MPANQSKTPMLLINTGSNTNWSFSSNDTMLIKETLSRGLAVVINMYVPDYDANRTAYNYFANHGSGTVLCAGANADKCRCTKNSTNHAVLLIGYGKKNGTDVWIVRNSWGDDWGSGGAFFVAAGHGYYCMEGKVYAVFPEHYDGGLASRGNNSERNTPARLDADQDFKNDGDRNFTRFYVSEGRKKTVSACPENAPYMEMDGLCTARCQSGMFTNRGQGSEELVCVDACDSYFIRREHGIQCVSQCTDRYPDIRGSECYCGRESRLAAGASLCYCDNFTPYYDVDGSCVTSCGEHARANANNICECDAATGYALAGRACVCNPDMTFSDFAGTCACDQDSEYPYLDHEGRSCASDCASGYYEVVGGKK